MKAFTRLLQAVRMCPQSDIYGYCTDPDRSYLILQTTGCCTNELPGAPLPCGGDLAEAGSACGRLARLLQVPTPPHLRPSSVWWSRVQDQQDISIVEHHPKESDKGPSSSLLASRLVHHMRSFFVSQTRVVGFRSSTKHNTSGRFEHAWDVPL